MEIPVNDILIRAAEKKKQGESFVLATIVRAIEKTPGRSGFKLLYSADGKTEGTVGGGELERLVIDNCRKVIISGQNDLKEYELTQSSLGIGMVCGGSALVYFEYFAPLRSAYIFGAGHLCRSILPVLKSLGFYCRVIDNRSEYADASRLPLADEVTAEAYHSYVSKMNPAEDDAILIFTHGHKYDFDILDLICRKNFSVKYVGMIGSRIKAEEAKDKIRNASYQGNLIDRVHAPIGLNIGKTTTQEIAISIAAEMLAVYNDVDAIFSLSQKNED
jgi:xanthine dehydrogenase accessory factor